MNTNPIIVGIDGTQQGRDAVALGRLLAEALGAPLVVCCSYGQEFGLASLTPGLAEVLFSDEVLGSAAAASLNRVSDLLDGMTDWRAEHMFSTSPARGLTEAAEEFGAQAIVIGSAHRGALGRALIGSVGERLLQGAPCAVAVAPRGYRNPRLEVIGSAYDATSEAEAALAAATILAAQSGAEVRVFDVLQPPNPANPLFGVTSTGYTEMLGELRRVRRNDLDRAADALSGRHVAVSTELLDGNVVQTLVDQTATLDLLTIGSRRYGPVRRVAAGAVSIGVLREAACPVMVVPRGVESPLAAASGQPGRVPAAVPAD